MKIKIILILTIGLFCKLGNAQGLSIELDLSNAKKTTEIFNSTELSETQIDALVQLESSKALLRKLQVKDSVMIQAITKAYTNDSTLTRAEKRFQFDT